MDDLLEIFSNNLKRLMKSRGENIKDLSLKIDTPYTTVSNWVRGNKLARSGGLQALSKHYHVPLYYLTTKHTENEINQESHVYNFFDAGLSAGVLTTVDPFKATDIKKITVPDLILGKYAGDNHLFITYINGESMNRILPDHSLIAVKEYDSVSDLKDSDIVAFEDSGEMCVKLFYKDFRSRTYSFMPSSTDPSFKPITYRWEEANQIKIVGKVVTYVVNI